MVLCWDYEHTDKDGTRRDSRASQDLLNSATYPVMVSTAIDDRARESDPVIQNLFEKETVRYRYDPNQRARSQTHEDSPRKTGKIASLGTSYGHIDAEGGMRMFFPRSAIKIGDFKDLDVGDSVEYIAENTPSDGWQISEVRKVVMQEAGSSKLSFTLPNESPQSKLNVRSSGTGSKS